jgi:IPT/TIG domain
LSVLVSSLGFTTEASAAACATVTFAATPLGSPQQSQLIGSFTGSDPQNTYPCDPFSSGLASDVSGDESQLPGQTGALTNPPPAAGSHLGYTGGVFGTFTTDGGHLSYTPTSNPGFAYVTNVTVYFDNSGFGTFVTETVEVLVGTPGPTVIGISPSSGPTTGGTSVTITGTGFTGVTGVTIGGAAATSVTVVSPTSITAVTPANSAGTASVLVTTTGGTNAANSLYTYVAPPTVTGISPSSGSTAGGTSVTITGTGFTGATGVTIGGTAATSFTVVSSTSITALTPAGSVGTASVLVTTPSGTNAANSLYTYVAPPTVSGISPSSGPAAGGTSVTITAPALPGRRLSRSVGRQQPVLPLSQRLRSPR